MEEKEIYILLKNIKERKTEDIKSDSVEYLAIKGYISVIPEREYNNAKSELEKLREYESSLSELEKKLNDCNLSIKSRKRNFLSYAWQKLFGDKDKLKKENEEIKELGEIRSRYLDKKAGLSEKIKMLKSIETYSGKYVKIGQTYAALNDSGEEAIFDFEYKRYKEKLIKEEDKAKNQEGMKKGIFGEELDNAVGGSLTGDLMDDGKINCSPGSQIARSVRDNIDTGSDVGDDIISGMIGRIATRKNDD